MPNNLYFSGMKISLVPEEPQPTAENGLCLKVMLQTWTYYRKASPLSRKKFIFFGIPHDVFALPMTWKRRASTPFPTLRFALRPPGHRPRAYHWFWGWSPPPHVKTLAPKASEKFLGLFKPFIGKVTLFGVTRPPGR